MKTNTPLAATLVLATQDAYSKSRYTDAAWLRITKQLLQDGLTEAEVEWILRSKHMRWAADAANRDHSVTANDFAHYLVNYRGGLAAILAEARKEQAQSAPAPAGKTGADLAGFCEGEQIAALIDLVRSASQGNQIKNRATRLIAEIELRAKS
jgi:hypothetical protein